MQDLDYGKKARRDYEEHHPNEDPAIDAGYRKGEAQPDPQGLTKAQVRELRSKYASQASRYQRPAKGYTGADHHQGPVEGTPSPNNVRLNPKSEELIGGGVYRKQPPDTDEERCRNSYRWVEDVFWPKNPQPKEGSVDLDPNSAKLKKIADGELDVGKRLPAGDREGWYCIELAEFLAFLLRELGYKVQYKNLLPSLAGPDANGEVYFDVQTAALNVWFGGKWHLFDPFESFSDDEGGLDAYTTSAGNVGCGADRSSALTPYHDIYAYSWQNPSYDNLSWGAPTGKLDPSGLDDFMKGRGWTPRQLLSEAGILLRSVDERVRIGLAYDTAFCGYTQDGEIRDALAGAVYRPYGRLVGRRMGDPSAEPARDELISYNVYESGRYDLTLTITNTSYDPVPFEVSILASNSPYLGVRIGRKTSVAGRLRARSTRRVPLRLVVRELAARPPSAVRDLRAWRAPHGGVALEWSPIPGASQYRVFRRAGKELLDSNDLEAAEVIAEPVISGFEDSPKDRGVIFYAVLAVDARGTTSDLDPEEGSSAVVRLPARPSQRPRPPETN